MSISKTALENISVALPVRAVLTLIQLSQRAPLLDAERLWLEGIDREVAQTLRTGLLPVPPAEPTPPPVPVQTPPTHPPSAVETHGVDSPEAKAAREARKARRKGNA